MNVNVGGIGVSAMMDAPGYQFVGGLGVSVLMQDARPMFVGMVGVQVLMDAQVDETLKPESGAFLQIQKI